VIFLSVVGLVGCGGGADQTGAAAPATQEETAVESPAEAGQDVDNSLVSVTVPSNWDIVDDSAKMKMMNLIEKGSGGKVGVYLKVEGNGNWDGEPGEAIASFAESQGGSAPETITINGVEWTYTTYEAYGTTQTMMVTKKDGNKITATVLGDGYEASPDVRMILDSLVIK
jgi:3'-phosphoadenosine 5'-phosphosulfate (PAPS) 3'-phosphatase